MTLIDTLRTLLVTQHQDTFEGAMDSLADFLSSYDALAPDWSAAPEWAQWYAIDADGCRAWYEPKPQAMGFQWHSTQLYRGVSMDEDFDLPLGLDWRLCLFKRPDA